MPQHYPSKNHQLMKGRKGHGVGYPKRLLPGLRDGDGDGVVGERKPGMAIVMISIRHRPKRRGSRPRRRSQPVVR